MDWVKATERLPKEAGIYFVRRTDTGKRMAVRFLNTNWSHGSVFRKIPHLIEWLDEKIINN